ncbi:MAG: hypothetical protein IKP06_04745 [Elusimicrobiaceae bacterium]|nr:hypothetical protein [Elusimicrobiaceae bacterium]
MKKYEKQYFEGLKRVYTKDELLQMVSDKDRILTPVEVSKILDTFWPLDYKDTFIVPKGKKAKKDLGEKGRYLVFRGGGILFNGKNDVPGLKALGEKEKTGKLLLRRSKLNRILAGETDCLKEPLTPEAIGKFERERDLIQEGILKAVEPLLDPDSIITQPGEETAGNGKTEENNGGISLPPEIDRPEARKAFEKALKAGYLEKTSTGYKWKGLPKAAAAYLCEKIYCPAITDEHPDWGLLGQFLGFDRLAQTAYQNRATQKEMPWKRAINELFED